MSGDYVRDAVFQMFNCQAPESGGSIFCKHVKPALKFKFGARLPIIDLGKSHAKFPGDTCTVCTCKAVAQMLFYRNGELCKPSFWRSRVDTA